MENFKFTAPVLFGLESVLGGELKRMGAQNIEVKNGRVDFCGDAQILARANIGLRCAERVLLKVGEFKAYSFTELFDNVSALPWENYIRVDDAFPVTGWSVDSKLHSVPDCQSIIKKAVVKRLGNKYGVAWFQESGPQVQIRFSVHKDEVTVCIDTSGDGLHKRGYRRNSNSAPLKETLAAGMCDIARIYPDTHIVDPFCGSGTILIEAALKAANIAPGLNRYFAAEKYCFIDKSVWQRERMRAQDEIRHNIEFTAFGSDIDTSAVELTLANAKKAGVGKYVTAKQADVHAFKPIDGRMLLVTNPPYGERLLDVKAAEELYKTMGKVFERGNDNRYYVISPHDEFESIFGATADKRRKLYNGMIKCQMYMYFK